MTTLRLRYIQAQRDPTGSRRMRYYFRRRGAKLVPLPGLPGSAEFMDAYQAALAGAIEIGGSRTKPGSFNDLVVRYYRTELTGLAPATQVNYRRMIEQLRAKAGDLPVTLLERRHIEGLMNARAEAAPTSANHLLRIFRSLMAFAVKQGMRKDDPTFGIDKATVPAGGHPDWGEDKIATCEAHYPTGTAARLALALYLFTAGRLGDVIAFGPHNIRPDPTGEFKHGLITYTQDKNHLRKPVVIEDLPVHEELARIIAATPVVGTRTFLVNQFGRPWTKNSFGHRMRKWCNDAGLPDVSSHGLRKAALRRLAEAGATPHQLMAFGGHRTLKEVVLYTDAVDKKRARREAMNKLDRVRK